MQTTELDLTGLTADIVSAYVAHNALTGDKVPEFIGSVYGALSRASVQERRAGESRIKTRGSDQEIGDTRLYYLPRRRQAVQIPQAASEDLYDMSPDDYREKWGLPQTIRWSLRTMPLRVLICGAKNMGLGRRGTAVAGTRSPRALAKAEPAEKSGKGRAAAAESQHRGRGSSCNCD